MKLLSHADGKYVIRLDSREHDALLAAIGLRTHLPRARRSLTADTAVEPGLRAAQGDLDTALAEHRQELNTSLEQLLGNTEKVATQGKGKVLTLTAEEINLVLQGLNDVRVAAWERLGCPDFDHGQRPEVTQENFLCLWTIQATDLFQSFLLAVLTGEIDQA